MLKQFNDNDFNIVFKNKAVKTCIENCFVKKKKKEKKERGLVLHLSRDRVIKLI